MRNPLKWRMHAWEWITCALLIYMIVASLYMFAAYVDPSLSGKNDLRIGPDSAVFLWGAGLTNNIDAYHSVRNELPLLSTGGSVIGPVLIAWTLRSNVLILCFNYVLFFASMWLISLAKVVRVPLLMLLLLSNPCIMVSLLTINKEILVVFSIAMLSLYFARSRRSWPLFVGTLIVSLFARWQNILIILIFLALTGRCNPLRRRRKTTIVLLLLFITMSYPLTISVTESALHYSFMRGGDLIATLSQAEEHFLYFAVVFPKAAMSLYADALSYLINGPRGDGDGDVYHNVLVPLSSLANIVVSFWFVAARKWDVENDMQMFALVYCLICSIPPMVQVRYFLPIYMIICMELASSRRIGQRMQLQHDGMTRTPAKASTA